jgi:hypothetical protein
MLHSPRRHERLESIPWDEERARSAIARIAADAEDRFDPVQLWPAHPLDGAGPRGGPHSALYLGAAGVLWALDFMRRADAVSPRLDLAQAIRAVHLAYLAAPDSGSVGPSLFLGETGVLLVAFRISASATWADRLEQLIAQNRGNPANELFWGAPGTLLAAIHLYEVTGEERWRALIASSREAIWTAWTRRRERGCHLWTQHLYGEVLEYLGGAHGFAGNAHALLRASSLLPERDRRELFRRCADTALATARVDGDCANWPAVDGRSPTEWLVQWCHGAPGVVCALSSIPSGLDERLDRLLASAAELVWQAGPLRKGSGLCHGTAGNGYAFLKLHRRTGEVLWLERARAFAMHALGQWERATARYGRGRYSLWTGDVGLALYLLGCIRGQGDLPLLDVL